MDWRYKIVGLLLLIFLTSCSLIPSGSQPPEGTAAPTGIETTPAYPGTETPVDGSATPSPSQLSTFTPTPELPTLTSSPVETATPEDPTQTPTLTPTKQLVLKPTATQSLLDVQLGSPIGIPNFAHPELGCQWMGVAGQVFDIDGTPMEELVIEFGGTLAGQDVFGLTISGHAEIYGPGGYEYKLADQPIASSGTVWARVYDFDGIPLSDDTYFSTYATCDQNLIILNFVQAYEPPTDWVYLPLIFRGK